MPPARSPFKKASSPTGPYFLASSNTEERWSKTKSGRVKSSMAVFESMAKDSEEYAVGHSAAAVALTALTTGMASSAFISQQKRIRLRRLGGPTAKVSKYTHSCRLSEEVEALEVGVTVRNADGASGAAHGGAKRVEITECSTAGAVESAIKSLRLASLSTARAHLHLEPPPTSSGRRDWRLSEWARVALLVDVAMARTVQAASVVVGALDEQGRVDEAFVAKLVHVARPMRVSWCRAAFEQSTTCPEEQIKILGRHGVESVYTSGAQHQQRKMIVWDSVSALQSLNALARECNVVLVATCGVNIHNAAILKQHTGVTAVMLDYKPEPTWRCRDDDPPPTQAATPLLLLPPNNMPPPAAVLMPASSSSTSRRRSYTGIAVPAPPHQHHQRSSRTSLTAGEEALDIGN